MIFQNLSKNLDKKLALFGVFISLILIIYLVLIIKRPIYVLTGIITLLACLTWLIIRKNTSILNFESTLSDNIYLLCNILFFVLLLCSILSFYLRPEVYGIPLSYYIFMALMVAIVSLEILFFIPPKNTPFVLIKIIIIGLSLSFSKNLIFPNVIGVDPWVHQMFTLKILSSGHVPSGFAYSKLPIFHLEAAITSLIVNSNYKFSIMLSWNFVQVAFNVLIIFLLGKLIFNEKVGAFGGLLLSIANYQILMSSWTIPSGVSSILALLIIYFLFKFEQKMKITIMLMILMFILILTHTITSLFMAIILFFIWIFLAFYEKVKTKSISKSENFKAKNVNLKVSLSLALFFLVLMLVWWIYASNYISTLSHLITWGFSLDYFINAPQGISQYAKNVPLFEQISNYLGMFVYFALSFIGILYLLSDKVRNLNRWIIIFIGLIPLSLGFFSIISQHTILEARWWYLSQIFISIPVAVTLLVLCNIIRNNSRKAYFLMAIMISLSFLMFITLNVMDNNIFSPNTSIRYGFETSEIYGASFFSQKATGNISSDFDYCTNPSSSIFINYYNVSSNRIISLDNSLYNKNFTKDGSIKIIRNYIVKKPFRLEGLTYKLNYDPNIYLSNSEFNKIYDNHEISAYTN